MAFIIAFWIAIGLGVAYLAVRGSLSGMPLWQVIMYGSVAVMCIGLAVMMTQTEVDQAQLDSRYRPLVSRDYPGWTHQTFSYLRSQDDGGHGLTYLLTNPEHPGLRVLVSYYVDDEAVRDLLPELYRVEPGVLCDDGYFKSAADIARFQGQWERFKPDAQSIVSSVFPDNTVDGVEYWTVYATGGKNENGYDDPTLDWRSVFTRDTTTGEWGGNEFESLVD